MRVLALVTDAYGGAGGIAQAARDLLEALAKLGSVDAVDVLPRRGSVAPDGVPKKVRQASPIRNRILFACKAIAMAIRAKPGLVFCNHLFMAPLAALVAFLVRARLVIQLHGIEIWNKPTNLQLWGLRSADLLLCVSRDTRSRILAHCDIPPERALVLNNTVGPEFSPGDPSKARERFGFRDEFVLLTVGRLDARERYKGHDRVIEAIKHIRTSGTKPLIYLIAGDGDDKERLERMARDQSVSDHVRFLGRVAPSDLPDLYRAADLFVLPSTGEGFGIAYIEAMVCGTPAIGLAIGGAPDALGDGSLGACVSPEEFPKALAFALQKWRAQGEELAALVQERFGQEGFNAALANHLALLLAPDRAGQEGAWIP